MIIDKILWKTIIWQLSMCRQSSANTTKGCEIPPKFMSRIFMNFNWWNNSQSILVKIDENLWNFMIHFNRVTVQFDLNRVWVWKSLGQYFIKDLDVPNSIQRYWYKGICYATLKAFNLLRIDAIHEAKFHKNLRAVQVESGTFRG